MQKHKRVHINLPYYIVFKALWSYTNNEDQKYTWNSIRDLKIPTFEPIISISGAVRKEMEALNCHCSKIIA